ncbi:hypothetical protein CTAYLR_008458 [Chrysophaeum taylorii]|uniref:Protein kinase domain-containing protein n=1 Tax=Chrysophaeum taylorii TaxID=2483200 RepID=A0AAD7UDB9_9STRA|nr:hypothetical protein CTAYLR_008458 [Chrysophaeum taylorii]
MIKGFVQLLSYPKQVQQQKQRIFLRMSSSGDDVAVLRAVRAKSAILSTRWHDAHPLTWDGVEVEEGRVALLDLGECYGLTALPLEIGKLTSLTSLDLSGCSQMKTLPREIGQLTALKSLSLNRCRQLTTLPPEIDGLSSLDSFELRECDGLVAIPPEIGELAALRSLDLFECGQLAALPLEVGRLAGLASLELELCDRLVIPPLKLHAREAQEVVVWLEGVRLFLSGTPKNEQAIEAFFECIKTDVFAARLESAIATNPSLAGVRRADDGALAVDLASRECRLILEKERYVLRRFEIDAGPPIHFSAATAVVAATDRGEPTTPRRALKAMREEAQVFAEVEGRFGLKADFVVAVFGVYVDGEVSDEAYERLEAAAKKLLENARVVRSPGLSSRLQQELVARSQSAPVETQLAGGYKFLLVLELADRTLSTAVVHDRVAGRDFVLVRKIAGDVVAALDHLHSNGRIHADLTPLNIVRVDSSWRLIDMGASREIGEPASFFESEAPSSGYCPPELATLLAAERGGDTKMLYTPSIACDLWSLGCVLLLLVSGKSLWHADQNDDVAPEVLRQFACDAEVVVRTALRSRLYPGSDASDDEKMACALLRELLEPDESKRLACFQKRGQSPMQTVLAHPFLTGEDLDDATKATLVEAPRDLLEERTFVVVDGTLPRATATAIALPASNLRECVWAAVVDTSSKPPTAFVILFHSPVINPAPQSNSSGGGGEASLAIALLSIYRDFERMVTDPTAFAASTENNSKKMFLSLVCEMCWMPQPFAYEVEAEECRAVLPIAKATLGMIARLNVVALAECFYPGARSISKRTLDAAKAAIGEFDTERSVSEFNAAQRALEEEEDDDDDDRGARGEGYCLREYERLLSKVDPTHAWAKLERVVLGKKSAWVCGKCAQALKSAVTNASSSSSSSPSSYEDLRALSSGGSRVRVEGDSSDEEGVRYRGGAAAAAEIAGAEDRDRACVRCDHLVGGGGGASCFEELARYLEGAIVVGVDTPPTTSSLNLRRRRKPPPPPAAPETWWCLGGCTPQLYYYYY